MTSPEARELADGLRDAFAALARASLSPPQREQMQRRLLAITTASKRDVARAREQLARFTSDLHAATREQKSSNDE